MEAPPSQVPPSEALKPQAGLLEGEGAEERVVALAVGVGVAAVRVERIWWPPFTAGTQLLCWR